MYRQTLSTGVLGTVSVVSPRVSPPGAVTQSYDIRDVYYNGLGEQYRKVGSTVLISLWKCLTSLIVYGVYIHNHIYIETHAHGIYPIYKTANK